MILVSDMQAIARERLHDAEALNGAGRFDGCLYLCGYCVEIALKARICQTLNWAGFPEKPGEFQVYKSFQTHNLDVLLHLSGVEEEIKRRYVDFWSVVGKWETSARYRLSGTTNAQEAEDMLAAARELMRAL
jgi:HEPN domain-containing protein